MLWLTVSEFLLCGQLPSLPQACSEATPWERACGCEDGIRDGEGAGEGPPWDKAGRAHQRPALSNLPASYSPTFPSGCMSFPSGCMSLVHEWSRPLMTSQPFPEGPHLC